VGAQRSARRVGRRQQSNLTGWNEAYFTRFKAFVAEASKRGVVVEVTLFCP